MGNIWEINGTNCMYVCVYIYIDIIGHIMDKFRKCLQVMD